jgi:uncharacterized protein YlxP (DUF503 family)
MFVGVFRLEFLMPGVRTLKERRQIISSLKDKLRKNHNFSLVDLSSGRDLALASLGAVFAASTYEAAREAGERLFTVVENVGVQILKFENEVIEIEE